MRHNIDYAKLLCRSWWCRSQLQMPGRASGQLGLRFIDAILSTSRLNPHAYPLPTEAASNYDV